MAKRLVLALLLAIGIVIGAPVNLHASGVRTSPANTGSGVYAVTVDYSKTLAQMIATGNFGWTNPEIKDSNFPFFNGGGAVAVNFELVHFNAKLTAKEIDAVLSQMGDRPATLWEILAFAAKFPDLQRQFPIVALAPLVVNRDYRCVSYLDRDGRGRSISLIWANDVNDRWDEHYRYLVVRK